MGGRGQTEEPLNVTDGWSNGGNKEGVLSWIKITFECARMKRCEPQGVAGRAFQAKEIASTKALRAQRVLVESGER